MTEAEPHEAKRLVPWADPDRVGDVPAPFDLWVEGDIDYSELPVEDQRAARLALATHRDSIQELTGSEEAVRFLPGDRFTGVGREWLIERLVLSPAYGRLRLSPYEPSPSLGCFLDGELIDVLDECEGVPLGPGVDYWQETVASVGGRNELTPELVAATLYRGGPWLVSVWTEVHTDYLPLPENEFGEEKSTGITPDVWQWVLDMVGEWASIRAEHDLPVVSAFINDQGTEMLETVARAARGGRGFVTINGAVAFVPRPAAS